MGIYRALGCVDYDTESRPERPVIDVSLIGPATGRETTLSAVADTGFSGFLLVPLDTYQEFSELELPAKDFLTYRTMVGPILLRRARVIATIFGRRFETFIETPLVGISKFLLGRRILNTFRLGLVGPEKRFCLLEEEGYPSHLRIN